MYDGRGNERHELDSLACCRGNKIMKKDGQAGLKP